MTTVKATDGTITLDGEYVTIKRGGVRGTLIHGGRSETRYHLSQISGVEYKRPGLSPGRFTLIVPGAIERKDGYLSRVDDPTTVVFQTWHSKAMRALRDEVTAAIAGYRTRVEKPAGSA